MKINLISEAMLFPTKGGGMHTAFINQVELLNKKNQEVTINSLQKADVTHIHSLGPLAFYKLLTCKNTVISSHMLPETFIGSYLGGKILQKPIRSYLRFCYNKAGLIFAMSKNVKRRLEELGVTTRIELLANPLDVKRFKVDLKLREKGREEYKIKPEDFVVLGVGHLIPRKGLEDFFAVARKFPKIKFIWAGSKIFSLLNAESGEQKKSLKNIPENAHLLGHIPYETMPLLYNASDTLFFPSLQEIAPMVISEAAACGLPLVLRDLPEYEGFYGRSYLAGASAEDFTRIIKRLSSDREYFKRYRNESIKLAGKFDSDSIANKMLKFYNSLINK